jgi:hypothetical protein
MIRTMWFDLRPLEAWIAAYGHGAIEELKSRTGYSRGGIEKLRKTAAVPEPAKLKKLAEILSKKPQELILFDPPKRRRVA